jgi:hypothetical protein
MIARYRRIGLIFVAVALGYWFVIVQVEKRQADALFEEQYAQSIERTKGRVEALKLSSGGSFNWMEKLFGGQGYRLDSILTIELEEVLIKSGPSLIVTTIVDVVTLNETHYQVYLKPSHGSAQFMDLSLSLQVEKEIFNQFLLENPTLEFSIIDNVVVAVQLTHFRLRESERGTRVGYGKLLDIVPVSSGYLFSTVVVNY